MSVLGLLPLLISTIAGHSAPGRPSHSTTASSSAEREDHQLGLMAERAMEDAVEALAVAAAEVGLEGLAERLAALAGWRTSAWRRCGIMCGGVEAAPGLKPLLAAFYPPTSLVSHPYLLPGLRAASNCYWWSSAARSVPPPTPGCACSTASTSSCR